MRKVKTVFVVLVVLGLIFSMIPSVFAAGEKEESNASSVPTLKIGVLGVMSGAAASWGLVCKYSAEAAAKIYNDKGGVEIDGVKYMIDIVSIDTKQDPKIAVTGAERLVSEGIHYVIGPNVDNTAISVMPVFEDGEVIYVPYSFNKKIYSPPHDNAILGMIASYQSAPAIYKYLKENKGVEKVAFVARNQPDPLNQRTSGIEAAKALGLEILSWKDTYEPGTSDFYPVMTKVIKNKPDLIVLSGVSPGDAPLIMNAVRELGYKGLVSTETSCDATTLNQIAGKNSDGFIYVGGATTPEIQTEEMKKFIDVYVDIAGEWNDEAGTKVYGLPAIIWGLQEAGAAAIKDIDVFKEAIPRVSVPNPYVKGNPEWKFVGMGMFNQLRQLSIPMVVNIMKGGEAKVLFVGSAE